MGSTGSPPAADGFLAGRAAAALKPCLSYFPAFLAAQQRGLWSPDDPEGYISMVVAENRLSTDLVQAGLNSHATTWPTRMLHYQDARGIEELRTTLASMLQHTFMKGVHIDPHHLTVLSGCGSVIDLLLHCAADAGDAVLIPAPYYPAFDNDLQARNQVHPTPAYLDLSQADLAPGLDAAAAAARQAGRRVAAVLFTHPTNPQGLLYSRGQLQSIVSWCLKNRVHCIGDEVYALSVFDSSAKFVSTAHVVSQDAELLDSHELADDLVHIVFGASKDFCGSGLRLGVLHTKNAALTRAMDNLAYFCSVPGPLQMTMAQLLADTEWLDGFLAENRRRLRAAYTTLTGALDEAGIPYTPAPAGMFLWVDMRAAFAAGGGRGGGDRPTSAGLAAAAAAADNSNSTTGSPPNSSSSPAATAAADVSSSPAAAAASWQDEAELWQYMVDVQRLVLTPGHACHAAEPGFFRMCWAWPHPDSIPVAVQRLSAARQQFRVWQQQDDVARQQQQQKQSVLVDQQQKAQAMKRQQQDGAAADGAGGIPTTKLGRSNSIDVQAVAAV